MVLSNDLVSQFVKITNDKPEEKRETTVYGTTVVVGDKTYVKFDGSDLLTPVTTTSDVKDNERVTVMVKDHTATITGNVSSPSASSSDVKEMGTKISEFEIVIADKVSTQEFDAEKGRIDDLVTENVSVKERLTATEADIAYLETDNLEVKEKLTAAEASIGELEATKLDAEIADLTYATIGDLEVTNADIHNLEADYGEFQKLTTDKFTANEATIKELESSMVTAESLKTTYATIDFSNIGEAAIKKLFSDSGLIEDLVVGDGTITGQLVGVTIKGDLIEGNTVVADKLVIKGEDGLYYKLNTEGGATVSESITKEQLQNGLSGSIIVAKSITAEKVAVDDLVAFDATIGGFNITDNSLYSGVKESVNNTTRGVYLDSDGQIAFGDQNSYLKYYRDTNGDYKLAISASSLIFSSSGKSVEEVIDEAANLEIGARNLIRNSENLIFDEYGFEEGTLALNYDAEGNVEVESNMIGATEENGNAEVLEDDIFTVLDDGTGNITVQSELDGEEESTSPMKTLTIGGIKFEIVDEKGRNDVLEMIGIMEDLLTEDKSNLVAAINEVFRKGGTGTGPGGGGVSSYTVTLTNLLESRVITVPEGEKVELKFNYSSVDDEGMDDGAGMGQLLVGGIVRQSFSVQQGDFTLDVTKYLTSGTNNVSVKVTNSENVTKTLPYTITLATVSLISSFDASVPYTGAITFPYTPTGLATKTVHFELDGSEIGTAIVTTSGRQVSYNIPAQSHGAHILRVWFTCDLSGTTISSNILYYSIICTVVGNNKPIIAVTTPPVSSVEQFSNIVKKYRVYNPLNLTSAITLEANDKVVSNLTVDRTEQTWSYQPLEVGELTQTIRCGDEYVSWIQTVTESSIKVEAETEALALHLSSYGRNNNEANPGVWENNGVSAEFSNFNFVTDGWLLDDKDISVLRVTGDARLNIPYKIFAYDFRTTGKTLEFELATREVLNYDAEVLTCYSGGRGFIITAQQLSMASEQSALGTRYKEDEHIRVSIVAEKRSENRLLKCYINGIMSGAVQYPDDDDFSQANPVGITIGSNDCTVDLYNIRAYDNSLTRHQILDNWIADTQDPEERIARYKRNEVYDAYGQIVIAQLPSDLPYMVLQASTLPQFKGDKKPLAGYYTDPTHPERSFTIADAEIDVQGTSSQYYYVKNYKIKYKNGFILYDGSTAETYQMNEDAVPTDTFTMKADVASSEGAFNVVLSMMYNELCPFKTPAQIADPKIRQTIEGFPIVMFWDNGTETKFIGKYNFNNDKGTEEVFGFQRGDESWETLQNGTDRVGWHSADFSDDSWKTDFEARYPDKNTDTTRLQALAEWLVSTDVDQATGNAITPVTYDGVEYTVDNEAYRLAKFSAELDQHFIEDAIIFYYLYTEIFLSIDQREKNAFPTYIASLDRWIVLFYDADSSCGTDNKGNLTFDYYLEDIDYTQGGDPIYNGQNSVLWRNLRATRYDEIMAMYQDLRTKDRISYDIAIGKFNTHQSKWPEAIFNEDMQHKCLDPLINDGDGLYLPMLQGKKEQWMKWWLYNRFRYLDSKYITGTSMTNRITIRTRAKANVSLTSYVNMYGHVYYNAEMVEHRMTRGQEYEFVWAASGAEDAVIGINDADMLTSLGDLAPLMVELIDASKAIHITQLKLGDSADTYRNYSMNSITLGNNKLLRILDVRNCPNLTAGPDISGCTNIEEIYFDGSSITGLRLPNGGVLKKLHLPGTMANLTIRNQSKLEEFVMPNYSNITTLWLENNSDVIDPIDILNAMPANSRVRILGLNLSGTVDEIFAFFDKIDTMRGLDENGNTVDTAQISGTVYIPTLTSEELYRIHSRYPSITVVYSNLIRYTVRFWNGSTLLQTVENVDYLGSAEYTGEDPIKAGETDHSRWSFAGWSPSASSITGDTDCYAVFTFTGSFARELVKRTLEGKLERDETVTTIGTHAFSGLSKLTYIDFPNATSIGANAFENTAITHANFQKVTDVNSRAFANCKSLISISLPSVVNGYGVSDSLFSECTSLTSVDLSSITDLGQNTFSGCSSLEYLSFPSLNGNIYTATFNGCTSLKKINFNKSPKFIRSNAFQSCTSLEAVIIRGDSVATLSNANNFSSSGISAGTGYIYVPRSLVDSYKTATNWSTYATQIRVIEDYPDICGGDV